MKALGAALVILEIFSGSPAFGIPVLRGVTNTNDSGDGSLRQAISDANVSNTGDTIIFDSSVTGTITLTSGYLLIASSMRITGPGASIEEMLRISGWAVLEITAQQQNGMAADELLRRLNPPPSNLMKEDLTATGFYVVAQNPR